MSKNNKIIAFEGLDCSFKETNFKSFVHSLYTVRDEKGFAIHTESFPRYGYWAAKPAECWLNGKYDRNILQHYPMAKCALYNVDRMDYWLSKNEDGITNLDLLNSEDKFHYFIFDRYILSNTIYNPIHPGEVHIEDFVFEVKKEKFNGAGELRNHSKTIEKFSDAYKKYNSPYEYTIKHNYGISSSTYPGAR